MTEKHWINQDEIKNREFLLGHMTGARMTVYVKKFEILQKETANSAMLSDCMPIIMNLITCDLNVDRVLQQSLLRSLVQMVVSSESVVQKLSATWKTDVLMTNLLRVMREHVMTQYKYYQLYTHNVVTVLKCLAQVISLQYSQVDKNEKKKRKNNKAKENEFIKTTYLVGKDRCNMLDILLKPMQYLVNMNNIFNDLGCMLLDSNDTNYISEIKRYLTQVFNKIQNKLDLLSKIIDEIVKQYENRGGKKKSADKKWKKIKEKLKYIFEITIVKPCSFTLNLYLKYYFPTEDQMKEYLNNLVIQ